ncbi:MAG: membrane protein insertion efficiency factor YidD [Myxococcota bacterium]
MLLLILLSQALAGPPPRCRDLRPPVVPTDTHEIERVGLVRTTLWLGLRFYQVAISPADGATCSMYPSCSRYAMEAIARNGPVTGYWMASSRILSTHQDPHLPTCTAGRRVFFYNPPSDDEWWK